MEDEVKFELLKNLDGPYPKTIQELLSWPQYDRVLVGRSPFFKITGNESEGHCFWCGKELPDRKGGRHYCLDRSNNTHLSCYGIYNHLFNWNYASPLCQSRFDHKCAFCGYEEKWGEEDPRYFTIKRLNRALEVHHIFPLDGMDRWFSPYNVWWNLICLCHDCHLKVHALLRPPLLTKGAPDRWEDAKKIGQGIFNISVKAN